jgi:dTDP-4-amino-4,6-dideoxy-D-glucose acyltransferase
LILSFYYTEELQNIGFKAIGKNVKISRKSSIYNPSSISIGDHVRIDDFCILSGGEKGIDIGSYIHMAAYSAIYGSGGVVLKNFTNLSSRVVIYSVTDDFSGLSLTNPTVPDEFSNVQKGEVILNKHVIVGTNSTILPNVVVGEGVAIGAHSLVKQDVEPWGIYAGVPVKKIKNRKKDLLTKEEKLFKLNNYK